MKSLLNPQLKLRWTFPIYFLGCILVSGVITAFIPRVFNFSITSSKFEYEGSFGFLRFCDSDGCEWISPVCNTDPEPQTSHTDTAECQLFQAFRFLYFIGMIFGGFALVSMSITLNKLSKHSPSTLSTYHRIGSHVYLTAMYVAFLLSFVICVHLRLNYYVSFESPSISIIYASGAAFHIFSAMWVAAACIIPIYVYCLDSIERERKKLSEAESNPTGCYTLMLDCPTVEIVSEKP